MTNTPRLTIFINTYTALKISILFGITIFCRFVYRNVNPKRNVGQTQLPSLKLLLRTRQCERVLSRNSPKYCKGDNPVDYNRGSRKANPLSPLEYFGRECLFETPFHYRVLKSRFGECSWVYPARGLFVIFVPQPPPFL